MTINDREAYGIFAAAGILFNHESPLRGPDFVTRKISIAVARMQAGRQKVLEPGNINPTRDWGYEEEYMEGMWLMLQAPEPDTFILANPTMSFRAAGIDLEWRGTGT